MDADFEDFVERVKDQTQIEDVIDATGTEYKLAHKRGNYLRGEVHDSLVVRIDEQYYVWNDKSEKGDVFCWLRERHNWDFMTSLEFLAKLAKIEFPKQFRPREGDQVRSSGRLLADAFEVAAQIFEKWLWADAAALDYVRGRGWTDETIRAAGLGFSGRAAPAALNDLRGELQMHEINPESPLGVALLGYRGDVAKWGHAWSIPVQANWVEWRLIPGLVGKTRLIYPHWEGGRVRYFSGRNILGAENNQDGRVIKSFNLPSALVGKRRLFYNQVYGRKAESCVAVEGQADAVTIGQWNITAVAICGTSWEDHAEELRELRKRHATIYIGLDGDDAGLKALHGQRNEWPLADILGPMARVVVWGDLPNDDAHG